MNGSARRWDRAAMAVLVAFCAFAVAVGPARAADTGLVAQWHLDNVTGGATPDSSGNGLTGLEVNGALVPGGRFASALHTTNPNDGFTVLDSPLLEPQQVTVLAWVKKSAPFNVFRTIVSKGSDSCGLNESFALDTGPDGGLRFLAFQGGSSYAAVASAVAPASIWNNEWHAVAGTFDGTTARLYVDGVQIGSASAPVPGGGIHYGLQENRLAVGRFPQGSPCDPNGFQFVGAIDEVRLYNRALTAAEVSYLQDAAATTPPSLPIPGGGPAPAAAFTASTTTPHIGSVVSLDGTASVANGGTASSYSWDVNGDGKTDGTCGPHTPAVSFAALKPGPHTALLKVTDAAGAVTQASTKIVTGPAPTGGSALTKRLRGQLENQPIAILCALSPSVHIPPIDTTQWGGPKTGCNGELQVESYYIAARGCLNAVTFDRIPLSERDAVGVIVCEALHKAVGEDCPFTQKDKQYLQFNGLASVASAQSNSSTLTNPRPFKSVAAELAKTLILSTFYVPSGPVRINGLDYTPMPGHSLVIIANGAREPIIVSSGVTITVPAQGLVPAVLHTGPLALPYGHAGAQLGTLSIDDFVNFIPGTLIGGTASFTLGYESSIVAAQLMLPRFLSAEDGGRVTAGFTMRATNDTGLQLSTISADNLSARLFGVGISVPHIEYNVDEHRLAGRASIDAGPEFGSISGDFAFRGDKIEQLDLNVNLPIPGVKLGPGIFLTTLDGHWIDDAQQTGFGGGATIGAGPSYGGGCAPIGVHGELDVRLDPEPVTFTGTGIGSIMCIPLVKSTLSVALDGYGHFASALADQSLGPVTVSGVGVDAVYFDGHFTAGGGGKVCIGDWACVSGHLLASEVGAGFCVSVFGFDVGAAVDFRPPPINLPTLLANLHVFAGSCDLSPWITVRPRAAQAGARTVSVAKGERALAIAVSGTASPTIHGPAGDPRVINVPASGPLNGKAVQAFHADGVTYVLINHPGTGHWTIDGNGITDVREASRLPDPSVSVTVGGAGSSRILRYRVRPISGQLVRLVERAPGGSRELGTVDASGFHAAAAGVHATAAGPSRGRVSFTTSDAHGTSRSIMAVIEQGGAPRTELLVARFRASPVAVGRPRHVRLRRSHGSLVVTWGAAPGAEGYGVAIRLSDGRQRSLEPRGTARRVSLPNVRKGTRVVVGVVATRASGARRGPVVRLRRRL